MIEPSSPAELAGRLQELERAVALRVEAERAIARDFNRPSDPQEESLKSSLMEREAAHQEQATQLDVQHRERARQINESFDLEQTAAETKRREVRNGVERRTNAETAEVTSKHDDARWVAHSVLDETSEDSPKRQFDRIQDRLEKSQEQQKTLYKALAADVQAAMDDRHWTREPPPPPEAAPKKLDALAEAFMASLDAAREDFTNLQKLRLPKLFIGMRALWLFIVLLAGIGLPVYFFVEPSSVGMAAAMEDSTWIVISAIAALLVSVLLPTVLYTISSMQLSDVFSSMQAETAAAAFYHDQWTTAADRERMRRQKEFDTQQQKMEQQLGEQLERFDAAHQQTLTQIEDRRQSELNEMERTFSARTADIASRRAADLAQADQVHQQQAEETARQFEADRDRLQSELDDYVAGRQQAYQSARDRMTSAWTRSLHDVSAAESAAIQTSQALFPDWPALTEESWNPPRTIPTGLRLGHYDVDLARLEGGLPEDASLVPPRTEFRFPAVLPFPVGASLLLKTDGPESRRAAVQAMQVDLLRMLTLLPPGKLRLTIFDPVGLGESFSGLMHLADYDELLITSRIWTETSQFEARLADLTEHMENVLQKYLRNEFSSIEAYNEFAGEVAEPYHVLVVADFPNKFSEQAARRLTSIATSGARCGVYLLMSADPSQPTPHGFDLADVEAAATTLAWHTPRSTNPSFPNSVWERAPQSSALHDDTEVDLAHFDDDSESRAFPSGRSQTEFGNESNAKPGNEAAFYFQSANCALARWPVVLDQPPPPETFTQIVKAVGEASKDVRRVEVSFSRIAPPPDDVWSRDSRGGIDLPLGRAGAMKLQHLRLGKGTSQHMLVAGKTGSGKSTFFHALITNAALHYSPEELEFYLVDFKKGVEFKAYAGGKLPHARVIAIESDREFGISVLQRLDGILHERGELFREAGVQDIAGFRDAGYGIRDAGYGMDMARRGRETGHSDSLVERSTPDAQSIRGADPRSMPRIMLVIDEFQEFFVEDDRDSQQAALLLDRLVRQGRAFGIHVVLGSQTLGGAYSLARSTLGQVAVRVALQCSEADAHLILSESNTAARLLTRPGEAIYNDSNGSVEGNHPFQIAWLPDREREGYLGVLQHFAERRKIISEPAIVFEGNIPSDPARNGELVRLIESGADSGLSTEYSVRSPGSPAFDAKHPQRTTDHGPRTLPTVWLGEAVEIGPPTDVKFPQQAGSNLLLIGQDPAAAAGILATGCVALAAQVGESGGAKTGPRVPQLWIFDGSPVGTPEADFWKRVANIRSESSRIVTPGNVKQALVALTEERERRERSNTPATLSSRGAADAQPPLFLLIASLSRFRDLRKGEDDYGFGSFGAAEMEPPADPARQFAELISKGPEQGMHVLAWIDSANNLDRWLSRQSLKEFELRVTFAMNAGDSSNLIDSPAASRLGSHRALLYREETGTTTKFRPYGPPTDQWLDSIRLHFSAAQPLESALDFDGFQVT